MSMWKHGMRSTLREFHSAERVERHSLGGSSAVLDISYAPLQNPLGPPRCEEWAPSLLWNQYQAGTDMACTMDLSLLFFGNLLSTVQKSIAVYAHEATPDQCRTGADGYMSASLCPIDTQLWDELHKASRKVLVRWKYQPPLFSIVGGATW